MAEAQRKPLPLTAFGDDLLLVVRSDHEIAIDADFWRAVGAGA